MSTARKYFQPDDGLEMSCGEVLHHPVLAYETWGELNSRRDNAIWVFTGLSPSAHAASSADDPSAGWWEEMIGAAKPIDTDRYFVICMNSLGSCFGSTGPASQSPSSGRPYGLDFPELRLEDIAHAGRLLMNHLGIATLDTIVGPSMGGMVALALAVREPGISRRLLLISTAGQAMPQAIALRSLQREMVWRDPQWCNGRYEPGAGPVDGLRLARKLGVISYRASAEWEQRFGRKPARAGSPSDGPFAMRFEVEAYLEHQARKFTGQFDANCYLYLSHAMDLFDLADYGGTVAAGLQRIEVERSLVVGVQSDRLFPLYQQKEIAAGLNGTVELIVLDSMQGHDSFLVDMDGFRPVIAAFFA